MSETRVEAIVLGAGIAGCALAHHLARRRFGPVVVVDPGTPAAGASGRAAGIVTEQLWDRFDVEVVRESRAEYAALAARWDPSAFTENGFVRWARDPGAARALSDAVDRLRSWGVGVERLDPPALGELFPWGRPDGVLAAAWNRTDAVVTPSAITEVYAELARRAGVDFFLGRPVERVAAETGAWVVSTSAGTVRAPRLVLATGAWTKRIASSLGHPLPLVPYTTQAAVLRPSPPVPSFPSAHDLDRDVYVRPESNGRLLAGDGTRLEEVDPDRVGGGGDERFVTELAESFAALFPSWSEAELVRTWAGVCTSTPDRRPLVGEVPRAPGLYTIAGFNGFGVMRAGGTARRLADLLLADGPAEAERAALRSVDPARFAGRSGPFVPRPGFTLQGGDHPRF